MNTNKRRLKIAMVSDTVNASAGAGAVVSGELFAERLRKNHDIVIISADAHSADIKLRGIRPTFVPEIKHGGFIFAIPDRKALRKAFADVDIVHLHLPFWLSFVALDEAKKAGKPVVASFHVQPENMLYNVNIRWPWLNRKIYQFWVNKLWNRADLVMCPSPFAVNLLKQHNLRTPAIAISNGIPAKTTDVKHEREAQHEGYFLIFMLGRLSFEKEQNVLIEAVRHSKHRDRIKIVIAGKGPTGKKLQRLAQALPQGAEIEFISEERKGRLLATADLFVHCSSVELEGMAVLEAIGAGLPVLVAEGPATASSDLALKDFRFPVGDSAALTKKIDWLIENPDDLKRASQLYQEAAQQMDISKSIQDMEAEYLALCS
jgi:glycosyltransferase involved in cell wall biosynthesis